MAEATTTAINVDTQIPINLPPKKDGTARKGLVKVPADVMTYFGILAPTTGTEDMILQKRIAHTRQNRKNLQDAAPSSVTVSASNKLAPIRKRKGNAGKPVRIPTLLKNSKGGTVYTTLRFPSGADVGLISDWLFEKLVKNKPSFFIHNGQTYSVLRRTGDAA